MLYTTWNCCTGYVLLRVKAIWCIVFAKCIVSVKDEERSSSGRRRLRGLHRVDKLYKCQTVKLYIPLRTFYPALLSRVKKAQTHSARKHTVLKVFKNILGYKNDSTENGH